MSTFGVDSAHARVGSMADRIADDLRNAILAHEFEPGDRLSAEALAGRLHVSPTPIREALARLAGEGWVVHVPQRGVRVADLNVQEMLEIYELRAVLEPIALRASVGRGDADWREEVRTRFTEMMQLDDGHLAELDGATYQEYEERHILFHKALLSQCGSRWLIRITDLLSEHSRRYRQLSIPIRGEFGSPTLEHQTIADACLAGDEDAAAAAVLAHMDNTRKAILLWNERTPT
jgi:GntR family transcriptional regulator, carbon starvation induced regulator